MRMMTSDIIPEDESVVEEVKGEEPIDEEEVKEAIEKVNHPKESQPVPNIDLNEPLPQLELPVVDETMEKAKKDLGLGFVAFALLLVVVGGIAVMYSKQAISDIAMEPTPTATAMPKMVSPTPMLIAPTFAVLNGSGVPQAAAKTATLIESMGYKVVLTGNADAVQTGTTIAISTALASQQEAILAKLNELGIKGKVSVMKDEILEYSVKIIIGK